jgi:cystathionine beta-lyase/cystathionine gamma-synthase
MKGTSDRPDGQDTGNGQPDEGSFAPDASFRTRAVHAGRAGGPVRPVSVPIVQTTAYAYADAGIAEAVAMTGQPMYARDGMPNVLALEGAVAELEGAADAHAVASGMAAISLTLLALLSAGDHVVLNAGGYQDTVSLLHEHLTRFGIDVTIAASNDPDAVAAAMTPATRLVLAETISNPGMVLTDVPGIATVVHRAGARLVVDNTFATPALCRPLGHGADLVIHSAGKFLGGHHDATGGVVAGPAPLIDAIRRAGFLFGPILSPLDAWLILRGIRTLAPRITWMSASAARIAGALADHPAVRAVRYPGLPDPDRPSLAGAMLPRGAGALLAFDLAGGTEAAVAFTRHLRTIPYVASVGGTETTVSFPPQPPTQGPGEIVRDHRCATLRMSVGLEDPADLIADIAQALDRLDPLAPSTRHGPTAANGRPHETS